MLRKSKRRMDVLPYIMNSTMTYNEFLEEKSKAEWTEEENKIFENALADIDTKRPDGWKRVAAMLPGKSVLEIISHYKDLEVDVSHIELGLVPCPGYSTNSFTLDWEKPSYSTVGSKRSRLAFDQERKKGVPWTEQEHKLFLMGLKKYGKGDWRNISRDFVVSRTPTQVASHAQKYFLRLNSGGKDKRRASIHDINLSDSTPAPPSSVSQMKLDLFSTDNHFSELAFKIQV